ncbi:MAG: hypothetical protein PHF24_00865 [Syntrophomonas sp.]|nr:hypothetical protein [Syntrophomonas sp.]
MKGINRTRWIVVILLMGVLMAILLLIGFNTINRFYEKIKLEPGMELQIALNNMMACDSFRYILHSGFTVDERKEVISQVEGEKSNGNTHIKGEMVNTPVDIYYIDRTIYNYDSLSKKWLVIESGTTNSEDILISELNPLSNFRFNNVEQVEKVGFEKIAGTECLTVKCRPSMESQLLENLWKDFEYHIWIDYHNDIIRKAVLTATNKRNEKTSLEILAEFSDFGKKIEIKAPDRSSRN